MAAVSGKLLPQNCRHTKGISLTSLIHSKALLLAETPPPTAEAGPSQRDKASAFIVRDKTAAFIVLEAVLPTDDERRFPGNIQL